MSARVDLYRGLMRGVAGHGPDRHDRRLALIDAFAHELAEKIRDTDPSGGYNFNVSRTWAADPIDPEDGD